MSHTCLPGHDILVWGPATEGETSSSGTVLPAGWVWTCECGDSGTGYATEEAAETGAEAHERNQIPQQHRDLLADRIDEFIARWQDKSSDQYIRGLRAGALIVRDGDKKLNLPQMMRMVEIGAPSTDEETS